MIQFQRLLVLCALAGAAAACGPRIRLHDVAPGAALPEDCRPILIRPEHRAPPGSTLLGDARFSDTGFSVRCDERHVFEGLRRNACRLGADIVVLVQQTSPNFGSTCHRVVAEFYRQGPTAPEGAVERLVPRPELEI